MARTPADILERAYQRALSIGTEPIIQLREITRQVEYIARNPSNRACARFLLACALAKTHQPDVDIRKPYTEIGSPDAYSGRTYDEKFVGPFVLQHQLPCNPTTAFLTPAFRNRNTVLTPKSNLVGRPADLYQATLNILNAIHTEQVTAEEILTELLRWLIQIREEKEQRVRSLLATLDAAQGEKTLSSEAIVSLIEKHIGLKRSSRLPVLAIAAVYQCAQEYLKERTLPLRKHNAADAQTGALGDVEITLLNAQDIVTTYEIKTRRVTRNDVVLAIEKVTQSYSLPDNYIFITTEPISLEVQEFAQGLYDETGVEFVILDCIGFLRHFLHLFHRLRMTFLETYQTLLLAEPESAVNQELKEAFLTMRLAAQAQL